MKRFLIIILALALLGGCAQKSMKQQAEESRERATQNTKENPPEKPSKNEPVEAKTGERQHSLGDILTIIAD